MTSLEEHRAKKWHAGEPNVPFNSKGNLEGYIRQFKPIFS